MKADRVKLESLLREYGYKRSEAEYQAEKRKEILYARFPELKEIEDSIGQIGLLALKRVLMCKGENEKAIREEMDLKFKELNNRKNRIYKENNIPEDYLEVKYECSICSDRGILSDGKKCKCLEQQIIDELYDKSNMKNLIIKQNFETLDMDIYSEKINSAGEGISQRELMEMNIKEVKSFIENIDDVNTLNLVFYGETGTGKTFLSSCIADEVIKKGYTVMYKQASELIQLATKNQFNKYEENVDKEYEALYTCDLLIIDDLGTEMSTKFTISEIYKLINSRIVSGKKFIISTNYSPTQINVQYTSRISYRLLESCKMLEFAGDNLRVVKL